MLLHDLFTTFGDAKIRVRNEPVQARSSDRVDALLCAAAKVVDDVGIELLTTAEVARRADAAIGTVYRYFPDRRAVLTALNDRGIERFLSRMRDTIYRERVSNWRDALMVALETAEEMHRREPGFTSVRLADQVSKGGLEHAATQSKLTSKRVSNAIGQILIFDCGWPVPTEIMNRLETAVVMVDTLLVRAFSVAGGDSAMIAECTRIVRWYLQNEQDMSRAA